MAAVVLLGLWTAGKTSTVTRLQNKYGKSFLHVDSDMAVSDKYGGWLGSIFLANADDPAKAQEYVDLRERLLLAQLLTAQQPLLLAAGPMLITREPFWSVFVNYVKPVCFHIQSTPQEVYNGLRLRRSWQKKTGLDLSPGFGSWDEGLITKYNESTGNWDELSEQEALTGISNAAATLKPLYEKYSPPGYSFTTGDLKHDERLRIEFEQLVEQHLFAATAQITPTHAFV